ncbi:MAG TPA: hypothetical protein VFL91_21280 [Thermomicrobiales bacterium]|nr:hypothetical protein [Thermomicrobiales bacterium]
MGEEWLSAAAASARSGLSARTLKRRADAGELRVTRGTKGYAFLAEDIDALAAGDAPRAAEPSEPPEPTEPGAPREDVGALAVRALAEELARVREENARLAGELARVAEIAGQWRGYASALEQRALPPPPKTEGFLTRLRRRLGRGDERPKGETP